MNKIFEKEMEKEMKWLGSAIIVFLLLSVFFLSFALLLAVNVVLADVEILRFINK